MPNKGAKGPTQRFKLAGAVGITVAGLSLFPGETRAANVTSTLKSGAGSWSAPARWTNNPAANTFPNNGNLGNIYDVTMGSNSVVLDLSVTVRSLSVTTGTLSGSNTLTLTGALNVGGAQLLAPVVVQSTGTMTLNDPTKPLSLGPSLSVAGQIAMSGSGTTATVVYAANTSTSTAFVIMPTGSFAITRPLTFTINPDPFSNPPVGRLTNFGTITQSAGAKWSVGWGLSNTSGATIKLNDVLDANALNNDGTLLLQSASASASIASGRLAGTISLAAGSQMTWAGIVADVLTIAGPNLTSQGTITLTKFATVSAATTIPGTFVMSGSAAILKLNADATPAGPATIDGNASVTGGHRLTASNLTLGTGASRRNCTCRRAGR